MGPTRRASRTRARYVSTRSLTCSYSTRKVWTLSGKTTTTCSVSFGCALCKSYCNSLKCQSKPTRNSKLRAKQRSRSKVCNRRFKTTCKEWFHSWSRGRSWLRRVRSNPLARESTCTNRARRLLGHSGRKAFDYSPYFTQINFALIL